VSEVDAGIQPDPAAGIETPAMPAEDVDHADEIGPREEAASPDGDEAQLTPGLDEVTPVDELSPELDEVTPGEPDWMATAGLEGVAAAGGLDKARADEAEWTEGTVELWPSGAEVEPPTMSQLIFVDVLIVLPSSNPVIVLQETEAPYRELRIPIGGAEGIAIGYAARRIATPRPLTHELMSILLRDFDLTLEVVRITGSSGGSFTAEIVVSGPSGGRTIDCRPSDAIALALRQRLPVPIMASPEVLDQAGAGPAGSN
jgi:hypothetical protein